MTTEQTSSGDKAARPPVPRALTISALVFALVFLVMMGVYIRQTLDSQSARQTQLETRVAQLTANQDLLASMAASKDATGSGAATATIAGASVVTKPVGAAPELPPAVEADDTYPLGLTSAERASGVRMEVGRISWVGASESYGWPVRVAFGNYIDGKVGFSVASDHGDVFNGYYYVDEASKTVDSRLLLKAPLTVFGWDGSAADLARSVSVADFAKVAGSSAEAGKAWRSAWFWLKLGPDQEIVAAYQVRPR